MLYTTKQAKMIINQTITLHFTIQELIPYINWIYFYHAWGINPRKQSTLEIDQSAKKLLNQIKDKYTITTRFHIAEAGSKDDDIILPILKTKIPFLRQQQYNKKSIYRCLSDYIRPIEQNKKDYLGLFAATIDKKIEEEYLKDEFQHMLIQTLSERLVEAGVEYMHQKIRTQYWGYCKEENLSIKELHLEHFVGIRPAIGYPSIPDLSLNFILEKLLDFSSMGVNLTENGAMKPHATVTGFIFSHPKSHYFGIGKIDEEQFKDYADRRGYSKEKMQIFLFKNID